MKVLRSGIDLYAQKCSCGCIFAYGKADTIQVQGGIQEWDTEVECPECHKKEHAFFYLHNEYKEELGHESQNTSYSHWPVG